MRKMLRATLLLLPLVFITQVIFSQTLTCFSTGINGTHFDIPCQETCTEVNLKIPDLRSTSDYTILNIPYAPMPFTSAGATEVTSIYTDDKFSELFNTSFPFCFYDSAFSQFVVGSNGVVTFDATQANCNNGWKLEAGTTPQPIPFMGTQTCNNSTGPKYPGYAIFSPYHDINPNSTTNSPNRKIEWRLYGLAPCRTLVVNFFEIPLFGNSSQLNTSQIVFYETTGIIDIFIREKKLDIDGSPWNSDLAILGLQKNGTTAHPVPGKNATVWEEYLTGYRFQPSGSVKRFKKIELLTLGGGLLQTSTQSTPSATQGMLDVSFPADLCPPPGLTKYLVKTYYSTCSETSELLSFTDTISVFAPDPLTGSVTTTDPSCEGASNGTATVIPNPAAAGPFEYSMDNGASWQSSPTFTGLAAGTYSFIYRNAALCISETITGTINPGAPLTSTVAVVNADCNGSETGTATVTVSNSGTFEYSLDGGITYQSSNIFTGLGAGSYSVNFREPSGCSGSNTFVITEPSPISATINTFPVVCSGQSNGQISLVAAGGTSPYTYSIDGTNYQASGEFNVAAGTYTVYIRDNNGCIYTEPVAVSEPDAITATYTITNASCEGGADGTITITGAGGAGNFQYSIDGVYQSSNIFYVTSGTYSITVRDQNNCTLQVANISVGMDNNLYVNPTPDPAAICEGLSVVLQPETNASQFSWSPSQGLNNIDIKNPTASPSSTTTYYLMATLGLCTAYDTITVPVLPAPIPDAGADTEICYGQSHTLQGSGGVSYSWTPSGNYITPSGQQVTVTPTSTTTYQLHVIDANGCESLQPDQVTIQVTPPIVVTATRDTAVALGDTFQLFASSAATDYVWYPATGLSDPNIPNPIVTVNGDITYMVTATTAAGCKGEATVRITVFEGPEIYVPSAFTPNNDGKNDVFRPFPVGIKKINYFRVFNRWGQLIYSTTNFNQGWDGKIDGKLQGTGTYVWLVEGVTKDDRIITKRGTVVLVR